MITKKRKPSKAMKLLSRITGSDSLSLAEFLWAIREGEELTLNEFAYQLGISKSHLCDIEKGRKAVSLSRAIEFAEILGYSKDQFARLALQAEVDKAKLPYKVFFEAA